MTDAGISPIRDRVRQFVLEQFYVSNPASVTDEMSLIDSGLVDSTGMMDVILFVETEFGFRVEDRETTPENLESISKIAAFVERKQQAAGQAVGEATESSTNATE